MSTRTRVAAVGLLAVLCLSGHAQAAPIRGLTAADRVAQAYDAILEGRFDEWPAVSAATCPPAPATVCQALELAALWWRIQVDPDSRAVDATFLSKADAAIASMEAWTRREPERAEAWFYRGAAYGARAQWRVLRGERLAAARDGKRIKDALERALALDPGLQDAWFGIGLYHYYADVAPTAAKILRFLLLLPGGDRRQGMEEMLRARANGAVLRGEIDYQLHVLDIWYERNPRRAVERLEGLRRAYPSNPHFAQTIAEIQAGHLGDPSGSLLTWRSLIEAARTGRVRQAAMALARAELGAAGQLDRLHETDLAIGMLRSLIGRRPTAPAGILPLARLALADALARMGDLTAARAEYQAVLAGRPPDAVAARARAGLRVKATADQAAYRSSLEGWRLLERGDLRAAEPLIVRAARARPTEPVFLYREARLRIAQRDDDGASAILTAMLMLPMDEAPTFHAAAALDAGLIAERRGDRAGAVDLFRHVETVEGADARTIADARRALDRLGAR